MSFEKVPNFLENFFDAEMKNSETGTYRFNSFLLDAAERQLSREDEPVQLTPKAFDVLVYLVTHGGHLVYKDELMQAVWPDSFVDEVNLPRTIHTLRRSLCEDENGNKFIETVPTKGYRFVAKIEKVNGKGGDLPASEQLAEKLIEKFEADGAVYSSQTEIQHDLVEQQTSRRSQPRVVLILTTAIILAVSATGFWFSNQSWPTRTGVYASGQQTNNGEAYRHYQQGRLTIQDGYRGDLASALASFEMAIELDPNYAAAYAGKADAKVQMFWRSPNTHDDISQARTAVYKAIELDESDSYAHTVLCRLMGTYEWDFKAAEKECARAIEINPADSEARREMALFLVAVGRDDEAMREIDAAIALAPTSFNKRSRGVILYLSGRYDEAIEQLRQVLETDPKEFDAPKWLMNAYEMNKDHARAFETRIWQMERDKAPLETISTVKAAFNMSGWPGVLRSMTDPKSMAGATTYAQLGENDRAFESLETLASRRAIMLVQIGREPRLDPIRNDPRFDDLLKRIGLKEDAAK